jgi:hypothetical protein
MKKSTPVQSLRSLDRRSVLILFLIPLTLLLLEYVFGFRTYDLLAKIPLPLPQALETIREQLWYFLGCFLFMLLIPALILKVFAQTPIQALGFKIKGTFRESKTYLFLYLAVLPFIYLASQESSFRNMYPFYKPVAGAGSIDFLFFEAAYCLQFLAVEFFFRGVIVLGLKKQLGRYSILFMLTPYCMLHFHKPIFEALGSILAGVILGTLAWETETVIYGWFLHYAVALTMDLLALSGT